MELVGEGSKEKGEIISPCMESAAAYAQFFLLRGSIAESAPLVIDRMEEF